MDGRWAFLLEVSAAERAAVEAALRRRDLALRVRERLEMVKAAALGYDLDQIAAWSGRTPGTVLRWLEEFRYGGVAALADAPRAGRPPKADAAYLAALEQAAETPPPDVGQPFDVWTSARLSAYLAEATGTTIAPGWLRVLLYRRRFACGRAKHTLDHLQDPAEVAACEEALRAAGEKGGRRPRRLGTPPPRRDAPGNQPLPGAGLAPDRDAADRARGRGQPPGDGLRQ